MCVFLKKDIVPRVFIKSDIVSRVFKKKHNPMYIDKVLSRVYF